MGRFGFLFGSSIVIEDLSLNKMIYEYGDKISGKFYISNIKNIDLNLGDIEVRLVDVYGAYQSDRFWGLYNDFEMPLPKWSNELKISLYQNIKSEVSFEFHVPPYFTRETLVRYINHCMGSSSIKLDHKDQTNEFEELKTITFEIEIKILGNKKTYPVIFNNVERNFIIDEFREGKFAITL